MERIGFSRTILGSDGSRYHLPPAEYYVESEFTGVAVRDAAKKAADTTGRRSAVLTTMASAIFWVGLAKAV